MLRTVALNGDATPISQRPAESWRVRAILWKTNAPKTRRYELQRRYGSGEVTAPVMVSM
jgi:hypothetical protein